MLRTRLILTALTAPGLLTACVQPAIEAPQRPEAVVTAPSATQFRATGDAAMSPSELVRIEAYLSQLGYDVGPIDGMIGPRTRAAIGAYEQADGQSPTGFYTPELLAALERSVDGTTAAAPAPEPAARVSTAAPRALPRPRLGGGGGGGGGSGGGSGGGGGGGGGGW